MLGQVLGMVLSEAQAEEAALALPPPQGILSLGRDSPADMWLDTDQTTE